MITKPQPFFPRWGPDVGRLNGGRGIFAGWNPTKEDERAIRSLYRVAQEVVRQMDRRGVPMLAGVDWNLGQLPKLFVQDELELMVDSGMSPLAALRTATINPAKYMEIDATHGSVQPKKKANLVLLEKSPLRDVRNTRLMSAVVLKGRYHNAEDLHLKRKGG